MSSSLSRPEPLPEDLAEPLAKARARLGSFARQILWFPEVTSTNDVAATLAERGAAEGLVVVAGAQTAGRGRHGRVWTSPPGAGLYVSIVLRPAPHAASRLTLAAGVAIADGIQSATGLAPHLKWPNDVYVGERKIAGVLAEGRSTDESQAVTRIEHVVLGFGINVLPAPYPPDIAARATSLEAELGRPIERGLLLAECLCHLAARYAELQAGRPSGMIDAWRVRARPIFGRMVTGSADGRTFAGIAEDVDEEGALLVRTEAGVVWVISGEIRWT